MGVAGFLATTLGRIVTGVVSLLLVAGGTGGALYAADYGFEATIVDKACSPGVSSVTISPILLPVTHTEPIGFDQCLIVQEGNFFKFNIRSERLRIWQAQGGLLIWDSEMMKAGGGSGGGGGGLFPR